MSCKVLWLGMDDCYTSWEQEEAIPAAVLREFEAQISVNVNETCCDNIGHTLHTLGITTKEKLQPETLKKPKTDRIVLEEDNGYRINYMRKYSVIIYFQ